MSRFTVPNASRRARQRALIKAKLGFGNVILPDYEARKARRKIARASRKRSR